MHTELIVTSQRLQYRPKLRLIPSVNMPAIEAIRGGRAGGRAGGAAKCSHAMHAQRPPYLEQYLPCTHA